MTQANDLMMGRIDKSRRGGSRTALGGLFLVLITVLALAGCSDDDCVNCVDIEPPVVPTGVHSISYDNEVLIQWYDISYHPYDGTYSPNVDRYIIYWRFYEDGDEYDGSRTFEYLGELDWDENFDFNSGLHYFSDGGAANGERYEYAVSAVNAAGLESALSYELVTDAPLPHSLAPVLLYDRNSGFPERSWFDFSLMDYGHDIDQPDFQADIQIYFENDGTHNVAYVETTRGGVQIQDFGVFSDSYGDLIFEGVSWAPADGYSQTGVLELIEDHIYVMRLDDTPYGTHYAKFGVLGVGSQVVEIIWAYQTISGLPELSVPEEDRQQQPETQIVKY